MFKLNMKADRNGTSLQDYTKLITATKIAELFGEPEMGGDKVEFEWTFEDDRDNVFTIYDYKRGSNYDPEYPPASMLWDEPYSWHIGGSHPNEQVKTFKEWFEAQF